MKLNFLYILLIFEASSFVLSTVEESETVLVVLLIRNKAHTLPYFLSSLETLSYPKNRIAIYLRSDNNQDNTINILEDWIYYNKENYHHIDSVISRNFTFSSDELNRPCAWTDKRFFHVINLKEKALAKARNMWADYIWFLDADVFMVDPNILRNLIEKKKDIVAPMLKSLATYSNYWCGMTPHYFYQRTEEYIPILERKTIGCFSVPMVHSCVLIDLNRVSTRHLSFNSTKVASYDGPFDDIITFAVGAQAIGTKMHVCNDKIYGFIPPPLGEEDDILKDSEQITAIKLEILVEHSPAVVLPKYNKYVPTFPTPNKLNFDEAYLINLPRRSDRRKRMFDSFEELGIDPVLIDAVDGKKINDSFLMQRGIKQLVEYKDPWGGRNMTYGEIGCFLSHYAVWESIIENRHQNAIIFEDDVRFEPYFRAKLQTLINQMAYGGVEWDLIYLGRKVLDRDSEEWVEGTDMVVEVGYSYWTLSYVLSLSGARKLVRAKPLEKMVPVDEYLPIMFNKHPEKSWMSHFTTRSLAAFSASPLLVYPTHYTGENGYFSDTEYSPIISTKLIPDPLVELTNDIKQIKQGQSPTQGPSVSKDEL